MLLPFESQSSLQAKIAISMERAFTKIFLKYLGLLQRIEVHINTRMCTRSKQTLTCFLPEHGSNWRCSGEHISVSVSLL